MLGISTQVLASRTWTFIWRDACTIGRSEEDFRRYRRDFLWCCPSRGWDSWLTFTPNCDGDFARAEPPRWVSKFLGRIKFIFILDSGYCLGFSHHRKMYRYGSLNIRFEVQICGFQNGRCPMSSQDAECSVYITDDLWKIQTPAATYSLYTAW